MKILKLVLASAVMFAISSVSLAQLSADPNMPVLPADSKPSSVSQASSVNTGVPGACKDCDALNATMSQQTGSDAGRDGSPKVIPTTVENVPTGEVVPGQN